MASYPALDVRHASGPETAALEDLLYAELDAFEPLAIQDHDSADGWRVFFRLPSQRDAALRALSSALGNRLLEISAVEVDDEDWARRSQAALEAIHVGRITVAPPWDIPSTRDPQSAAGDSQNPSNRDSRSAVRDPQDPGVKDSSCKARAASREPTSCEARAAGRDIVIVIEPSMGFGTGHHATTRLCLELLQTVDVRGRRVIDAGTGSGVLALAAWKLGATTVTAIDNDPDALQNARENIARNGAAGCIDIREADLSAASDSMAVATEPVDIVLANLTGADLQRHARSLQHMVAPAGLLIVSGFSPDELEAVVEALKMPVELPMLVAGSTGFFSVLRVVRDSSAFGLSPPTEPTSQSREPRAETTRNGEWAAAMLRHVVRSSQLAARGSQHVTRRTSHVARRTSHVARRTSHVTRST